MLQKFQFWFALIGAAGAVVGISIIIYATAYMNAGHPPASGIIALFVVVATTPVAGLCLLTAMIGRFAHEGRKRAFYYLFLGVNSLYIFVFVQIWFYKAILNKAI